MRHIRLAAVAALLTVSSIALAAPKHPHLVAAWQSCQRALQQISVAQDKNDFDMGGHAAKAKELLKQAEEELKAAAQEATENAGKKK
ncbi:MAG TPA: hypothetical protein VFB36_14490 [Nevskiaceae bacterium]|nr:hypothetical protein [Nevskiaceae bacterium]